jgi:FixJ family two-component response regulator
MREGTVFLVDDESDVRQSLAGMLQNAGFHVAPYESGTRFLADYDPRRPGCLLLDVHMPLQSGLELVEELSRRGIRIPVIFMTASADVLTAVEAMKMGAIEFLQKPLERDALISSLNRGFEVDRDWRSVLADYQNMESRLNALTENERATLQLVSEGNSNKVIASLLEITERAVERRRARIMRKLGARSLPEALRLTITHRVISELRGTPSRHNLVTRQPRVEKG